MFFTARSLITCYYGRGPTPRVIWLKNFLWLTGTLMSINQGIVLLIDSRSPEQSKAIQIFTIQRKKWARHIRKRWIFCKRHNTIWQKLSKPRITFIAPPPGCYSMQKDVWKHGVYQIKEWGLQANNCKVKIILCILAFQSNLVLTYRRTCRHTDGRTNSL